MLITSYILFGIFIFISIFHLIFCLLKKEKLRKISKVFCVGFLSLSLISRLPTYPLVYLGALFGAIGDYYLIKKEDSSSLIKGISTFYIGHILYALQILILLATPNWGYTLFFSILIFTSLIIVLILYPRLKNMSGRATGPGIAYFILLSTMLVISIVYGILSKKWLGAGFIIAGYVLFVTSDTYLLYSTYIKENRIADFYIMLTYLLAQGFICVGLALSLLI